jgi:protein-tyrosine-phosphatase
MSLGTVIESNPTNFMARSRLLLRCSMLRRLPQLGDVTEVLIICTANRVRSPFAEQLLRALLPSRIGVQSRGFLKGGYGCPGEAIEVAAEYSLDLSSHLSVKLTPNDLMRASLILPMEIRMAHELVVKYPSLSPKVFPLATFLNGKLLVQDVPDPYLLPQSEYSIVYDMIARCCIELTRRIELTERTR